MNIISNCCLGSDIYKLKGIPQSNPFAWALIYKKSLLNLIKNFDKIDFTKFKTELTNKNNVKFFIDNSVYIDFIHYKYTTQNDFEMYSNKYSKNIIKYAEEKYNLRLSRMNNEKPIFALVYNIADFDINLFNELNNLKLKYQIFIFTNKELKSTNENIKIFKYPYNILNFHPIDIAAHYLDLF